jgi:hypothetical protein
VNKPWSCVALVLVLTLSATLSRLQGQEQIQNVAQQLRTQYRLTRVAADGTTVGKAGTVLVLQQDGLTAIPASYGKYWYSNFKDGGRIKGSTVQHGGTDAASERRPLQMGEKVYVLNLEINQAEMVFCVQSCGACDVSAADPSEVPYRARLAIGFPKGYLAVSTLKQIEGTIGQVFAIESAAPPPVYVPAKAPQIFPATYVNGQAQTDQLRLNTDHSFWLQEAGQTYHGTFVVNGNTLVLSISETNAKTTATLSDNKLTDSSGQTWVLQERSVGNPPDATVLQNDDVIKMAKAGLDDSIIISKISSSKCQFDTSAGELIRLKESGIGAAVLKEMLSRGK